MWPRILLHDSALKTVNLDLLQAIVAFADSGSCKGAAQIVNRSQSAISIKLKKLEDDLGASLFTRTGRKISLNEKGKDTVSYARRILRISNELVEKATSRELTGTIRLGLPDDYISLLGPFLSRFSTRRIDDQAVRWIGGDNRRVTPERP